MQEGQLAVRNNVHWQGRTLKYPKMFWLTVTGLKKHWEDSRVDATWKGNELKVTTKNVSRFEIWPASGHDSLPRQIAVDGQSVDVSLLQWPEFGLDKGRWRMASQIASASRFRKQPGLQGPIDDAFTTAFIVVPPDKASASAVREAFYQRELAYTAHRWRELFRGDLPVKHSVELSADDLKTKSLILFGEPDTNRIMAKLLAQTPIVWRANELKLGARSFKGENIVPLAIYPNPEQPGRYIVLNSGPTIREKTDASNALQTPQLPDWAVLDAGGAATDSVAAPILDAGFFNEQWLP